MFEYKEIDFCFHFEMVCPFKVTLSDKFTQTVTPVSQSTNLFADPWLRADDIMNHLLGNGVEAYIVVA